MAEEAAPGADPRRENALRVLVIDDNRDAADTLCDLLELCGYRVAVAYAGPEGVAEARRLRPHVVLCDLGLPEMDGYEVAAALRADPVTSSATLIAISGYGQEEHRQRAREAGFTVHLTKPVDPSALQRLLAGIPAT